MSSIKKFEDIKAWQKARGIVKEIYKICNKNERKDFNLINQIQASAISIMANIAEGFGRRTDKEFINFLGIAHASVSETQSHLYILLDLDYIDKNKFNELYTQLDEISRMIQGLIKYLRS